MHKKWWKKAGTPLLLALSLGIVSQAGLWPDAVLRGYASQAAPGSPVTEYTEEELSALKDNVLEYSEIPGLIEQYNITFQNQLESYYNNPGGGTGLTREQLLSLAAELRTEAETLSREAEDMKDEIGKEEYQEYRDNIAAFKSYAKQLTDAAAGKTAAGAAAVRSLRLTRNEQTISAQEKMREVQGLSDQQAVAEKKAEIAELTYETAKRQQELGIYAEEDVLSAKEALDSANAALAAAKASLESKKQDLLVMLGWRYGADPVIGRVPAPDPAALAAMNPETDSAKAIENNTTLYTTRMTASKSLGGADKKARIVQDEENNVRNGLFQLYEDVEYKKAAYEAAGLQFQAATADKESADRKMELGMISRLEYLTAEASFLSAQASMDQAAVDLTAAIEAYQWAVKGMLDGVSSSMKMSAS